VGKVRARSDNNMLFLDFYFQGVRCREQTALEDTPANRKAVQRLMDRIDTEIANGSFDYAATFPGSRRALQFQGVSTDPVISSRAVTQGHGAIDNGDRTPWFRQFAEVWLKEKAPEWRPSYQETVVVTLNRHLLPEFGNKRVGSITRPDLLDFRARLAETYLANGRKLSNARINKIMGLSSQILNEAALRFDFPTPYKHIKSLRAKAPQIQPFSLEEVQMILNQVRPDYRNYLAVRFYTGMRSGEINGLQWKSIDFRNELILIRETFVQGVLQEGAKTLGSIRDIPMFPHVKAALLAQREMVPTPVPWVFPTPNWKPIENRNFCNRVWKPLLANLGIAYRRPYQTRHTAATLMLAAGEDPAWIAKVLGHKNTQMLFTRYSRYVPNLTRRDGSAMATLLQNHIKLP